MTHANAGIGNIAGEAWAEPRIDHIGNIAGEAWAEPAEHEPIRSVYGSPRKIGELMGAPSLASRWADNNKSTSETLAAGLAQSNAANTYEEFKLTFDIAIKNTLKDLKLTDKKQLVNGDQIRDIYTATKLLKHFRNELIEVDDTRVDHYGSEALAKRLNAGEQEMFRRILETELGLSFGKNVSGETNLKYFQFTIPMQAQEIVSETTPANALV